MQPSHMKPVLHALCPQATKPQTTSPCTYAWQSLWRTRYLQRASLVQLFIRAHTQVFEPQNWLWNNLEGLTCNMQNLFSCSFIRTFIQLRLIDILQGLEPKRSESMILQRLWSNLEVPPATCKQSPVQLFIHMHIHSTQNYSCSSLFGTICVYVCIHIYIYLHVHMYMYIYIYIYSSLNSPGVP